MIVTIIEIMINIDPEPPKPQIPRRSPREPSEPKPGSSRLGV